MSSESEEPKIIVDEDWKSKVQREKEELAAKEAAEAAKAEENGVADDTEENSANVESSSGASDELPPPPPASLQLLVTTLLSQALSALGQMPSDDGSQPDVNLPYAKHFIDLAGVVEEKTKGNLTEEESQFVTESLHQLRMLYVNVQQQHG